MPNKPKGLDASYVELHLTDGPPERLRHSFVAVPAYAVLSRPPDHPRVQSLLPLGYCAHLAIDNLGNENATGPCVRIERLPDFRTATLTSCVRSTSRFCRTAHVLIAPHVFPKMRHKTRMRYSRSILTSTAFTAIRKVDAGSSTRENLLRWTALTAAVD